MKTNLFIRAFLAILIMTTVNESCQKGEIPTAPSPSITTNTTTTGGHRRHSYDNDACSTYYEAFGVPSCAGSPTNCLCEVVIHSGWPSIMADSIAKGSSGVKNFFLNSTDVENTFPVLLTTAGSSDDSILCSGNYYITGMENTSTHTHYLKVFHNGSSGAPEFILSFSVE